MVELVSGLIERIALNVRELKNDDWAKIQSFGLEFYEAINVQGQRQILRYLNSYILAAQLNKEIAKSVSSATLAEYAMWIKLAENDFAKDAGWDNLLES